MAGQDRALGRTSLDLVPTLGTVVGGRFEVGEPLTSDALGVVASARDQRSDVPIFLRLLRPDVTTEGLSSALVEGARVASELRHKSILQTFGVGTTPSGLTFIATEAVDGKPLSDVLEEHRASGRPVSLRGAFNVLTHVCRAVATAQDRTCHGALRPSTVWITRQGRVKVGDFGIGKALLEHHGATIVGGRELATLAPEVRAGQPPDIRSDLYSLGALLYEMLTGRSPADGLTAPSQLHPDATPELDHVVFRCLAAAPDGRFGSPDDLRVALLPHVARAPRVSARDDFGLDENVEIDVDIDLVVPATDPAIDAARFHQAREAQRRTSDPGTRAPIRSEVAPTMTAPRNVTTDLAVALSRITQNDGPRFMLEIDGMDHGPFSGREVLDQIAKGQARFGNRIHNMDTKDRRDLAEHPDFAAFVLQFEREQQSKAHKESLKAAAVSDQRSSRTKVMIAAGVLVTLLAGGGVFLSTRKAAERHEARDQEVTAFFDIGRIQASASGDILPDPGATRGAAGSRPRTGGAAGASGAATGAGGGGGGEPGGPGVGSFEDAMNQVVDFGDLSGAPMTQLTGPQVAEVMNRHVGRVYSACVPAEQGRGGTLGRVQIDMAIAGDGHVLGASTRQGSPEFKACIGRAVRAVQFPSFGAPRMAARYSFDAS